MNSVTRSGLLATVGLVLLGIACGTSEGTRQDSGGHDVASSSSDTEVAQAAGGAAGGAGGMTGTGGMAAGGTPSTGGRPGTGGATTPTADAGLAPEVLDALPPGRDTVSSEVGTDQGAMVDGGVETRGPDTAAAEAAGREAGAVDAPAAERPVDVVTVDGAVDPGVDLSDCPNPHWLDDLVNSTSYNRPGTIDRFTYRDAVVFYTPPRYADQYSTLYDRCGTILCHPDGGLTGRGDGQCPDFLDSATGRTSIWPTL